MGFQLKKIQMKKNFLKIFCRNAFSSDFTWIHGLKNLDDIATSTENSLVVIGRKWGESKTKSIPLGVLFEYSEGDLKPRGLSETTSEDIDLLMTLIPELLENKQNLWRSRIILTGKPRNEWRRICASGEFKDKK